MKQLSHYGALLVFALLIGIGIFAVMPAEAGAYTCGFGCDARIGCNGQGSCPTGYLEYGVFYYGAPYICDHVCKFTKSGCVPDDECF